jgi:broad specificity phosphatase PhoE
MTRIVLVRHGHVPGIEPERFRGGENLELTERGVREAQLTAMRIAQHWQPAIVYTSTRKRCIATGRFIADACRVSSRTLEDIHDFDYGTWTERTHEDVRLAFPEEYRRWRTQPHTVRFPGGDSLQQLSAHAADALRLIVGAHAGQSVVVVGHDSSNRSLLLHAMGLPLSAYWRITQSPCGISEFIVNADGMVVVRLNETAHLEGVAAHG